MKIKKTDFPLLVEQSGIIYFDSAATSQRPQLVIDTLNSYYIQNNANVGRGIYALAEQATLKYEETRKVVAGFINAPSSESIVFTSGTTDSINRVAQGLKHLLKEGDEIVVTQLEHHSNFVPWQQLALETGALFKVIPVDKNGFINTDSLNFFITPKTKIVAITHVSNAIGVYNTALQDILKKAQQVGAKTLVDGAQFVGYNKLDVQALGCDFYVFSGHKMLAPTGVGILYVRPEAQIDLKPTSFGGGAIEQVSNEKTTLAKAPYCYEPGTLPIAQILGLGAAINYLQSYGMVHIRKHVSSLAKQFIEGAKDIKGIKILGSQEHLKEQGHVVSFVVNTIHAHDVAAYLDKQGICVRAGHHCAQPLAKALGYEASVRVSFYLYNDSQEVSSLLQHLKNLTN